MSNEKTTETTTEIETLDNVDEVTEKELQDVDATLQAQTTTPADEIKNEALRTQPALRTLAEIVTDLSKPLAPRHLKQLTAGPARGATYIPWPIVGKYLDFFAPGWSMSLTVTENAYGSNVVAEISIPTSDFGFVSRAGVGFEPYVTNKGKENEKMTGFGGSAPIASRQASKRSAAEFGLGKYLYKA
jgi:hypothetical protein